MGKKADQPGPLGRHLATQHPEDESVMNDSVRFPTKAGDQELGGINIMIRRPGTKPAKFKWGKIGEFLFDKFGLMWGVHDSERIDRIKPDFIIHDNSSVEQLHADLDMAMVRHFKGIIDTSFKYSNDVEVATIGMALATRAVI